MPSETVRGAFVFVKSSGTLSSSQGSGGDGDGACEKETVKHCGRLIGVCVCVRVCVRKREQEQKQETWGEAT